MAAIKEPGKSRAFFVALIDHLNALIADSVLSGSDSLTTTITKLTTERDNQ